ncbi:MAG: hypothetical protein K0A94_12735 [Desulfuromonadales bacterium]|nr:hypothetical protein [Desulfuromonadales bacterium]
MDINLIKGVFAVYVVGVALIRLMDDEEHYYLVVMKKVWGRSQGLTLHFIANVCIPMIFALVSFSQGFVALAGY